MSAGDFKHIEHLGILDAIEAGEVDLDFVEIMACPGGCVNGGGQPHVPSKIKNFIDVREVRAKGLYDLDAARPLRRSHENPSIKAIYDEYFGSYGSHKAHELLHTEYKKREKYK